MGPHDGSPAAFKSSPALKSRLGPIQTALGTAGRRARSRIGALAVTAILFFILTGAGSLPGWLALAGFALMAMIIMQQARVER